MSGCASSAIAPRAAGDILEMIEDAEAARAGNTGLNLTFAFDYGGQEEIAAAARELARGRREGRLDPETITPELFAARLFTSALPEPDLVIRTSGEQRLSNFLLWQSAYAELLFLDTLWPDFTRNEFLNAIGRIPSASGGLEPWRRKPSRERRISPRREANGGQRFSPPLSL